MEHINIVDLYSIILDYNRLFYNEVIFQNKIEKKKSAVLLMGLFNYIMICQDSDLRMDKPSEVVKLDRPKDYYYKTVDDKQIIFLIADYVAIYLPELEEDLKEYYVTYEDGIRVYTTYLNILADMYHMKERYSKDKIEELYQELTELHSGNHNTTERSYYH